MSLSYQELRRKKYFGIRCKMAKTYLNVCSMFLALVIDITSSLSSVAAGSRGNVYHVARAQKARTLTMMSTAMSGDNSKSFINQANSWCGLNGLLYSAGDMKYQAAPVALIPNTFPKAAFEYAQEMQPAINELVDTISRDKEFLLQHLVSVGESDTFVRKLLGKFRDDKGCNSLLALCSPFAKLRMSAFLPQSVYHESEPLANRPE